MSDEWISETEVADASLVILVGLVKPETIYEEELHFQKEFYTLEVNPQRKLPLQLDSLISMLPKIGYGNKLMISFY